MTTINSVLFDLDGTLVDSAPDLWGALNHVLAKRDYPTVALPQVRHLVGDGARALLARGFWGEKAQPPVDDAQFETAVTLFLDYYRDHLTDHSTPYPGAVQTLQTLKQWGVSMAIVTNKPEALARRMLAQLQLLEFFAIPKGRKTGSHATCVIGGDTLAQRKPAAEPLQHALEQLESQAEQAVMVGDSHIDIEAARAANCPIIWMSHGYHRHFIDQPLSPGTGQPLNPETGQPLNPDWALDHFDQLPPIVRPDHTL